MAHLDNSGQLRLRLALALILLPALGIIPTILAPTQTPNGPGMAVSTRVFVAASFVLIGLAVARHFTRTVPSHIKLTDDLTIRYLFQREEAVPLDQIVAVTVDDRSVRLKSHDSLPMTAKDAVLTIRLSNGRELSVSVPRQSAHDFQADAEVCLKERESGR
jgi:hypothetical protein